MGVTMFSKSLIQFSVDGWSCVPSLLFGLRPNCQPMPPPETPRHSQAGLGQSLVGSLLLSPRSCYTQVLLVCSKSLSPQSCVSSGGSMVGLMATSSTRAYVIPRSAAPRDPDPDAGHL